MTARTAGSAAVLFLLALYGFYIHPGHAFLTADTQIYLPILERLWDPSLYPSDPVALRPHVSYTIYDETAVFLRWLTGLSFEQVLLAEQILFRFCGMLGIFYIGRAIQLSHVISVLLASIYGLGGFIGGPSVMLLEVEPVPRGFAGPLALLAVGLACTHRWLFAGAFGSLAFLFHPPTVMPVLVAYLAIAFSRRPGQMWRISVYLQVAIAAIALFILSRLQHGASEAQQFLGIIPPDLEKLQRLRGAYVWLSTWPPATIRNYGFLYAVCVLAAWQLRRLWTSELRIFGLFLPAYGFLMLPVSWVLLEEWKWAFMPQFQPARAVLLVTQWAMILSALCGIFAARNRNFLESVCWLTIAFCVPMQPDVLGMIWPAWRGGIPVVRLGLAIAFAVFLHFAVRWHSLYPRWAAPLMLAVLLLPPPLTRAVGKVRDYPVIERQPVVELADWARENTPKDAVFLFPDAGHGIEPGMFRAYALRGLYVDWKSGGQVNLLREYAFLWWDRWQKANECNFDPGRIGKFAGYGIDYIAVAKSNRLEDRQPIHENAKYLVYRLR